MQQTATILDTEMLTELVQWIRALKEVGVSADKAAEVSTKFFMAAATLESEEDEEEYDEE